MGRGSHVASSFRESEAPIEAQPGKKRVVGFELRLGGSVFQGRVVV